jgi:hypothetical protein
MQGLEKLLDNNTVVVVVIGVLGVLVAWVTFGILNSQAQGQFEGYQLGGAAAGFAATFLLLTSFYMKVRKANNEPKELRARIEELQHKLLRGSPHPTGFEVEISEQQKLVLARPNTWQKRGGVMFDFQLVNVVGNDHFPARFTGSYVPITDNYAELGMDEFYRRFKDNIRSNKLNSYRSSEQIYIGGEAEPVKSIKVIAEQYMRLEFYKNAFGGKKERLEAFQISDEEYKNRPSSPPSPATAGSAGENNTAPEGAECRINGLVPTTVQYAEICHMFVACYHEPLKSVFFFEFMDDEKDFVEESQKFSRVLNSIRFLN